ncbi:MAG TPA: DinB family protein [Anaerolineales bacterium]|nr:DinB family protein [Anaerolineales bacterium]
MEAYLEQFLGQLRTLHDGIGKAVDGLPLEAIDWSPGPEMNSIGVLMVHVAGSEKHWLGDVIAGEETGRDREAEFRSRGRDLASLQAGLDEMLEYARRVVSRLRIEDLAEERTAYADGRTMPVGLCLLHVMQHTAVHLGHIQLTRQLWEATGRT